MIPWIRPDTYLSSQQDTPELQMCDDSEKCTQTPLNRDPQLNHMLIPYHGNISWAAHSIHMTNSLVYTPFELKRHFGWRRPNFDNEPALMLLIFDATA